MKSNGTKMACWTSQYGGVIGAFNCQGAGWDPKEQRIKGYSECYKPLSVSVHVTDIEWDQKKEAAQMSEADEFIVYLNQAEELLLVSPESEAVQITIQPSTFEIFSFVPIKKLGGTSISFAPVGLANMFNSGGTIQEVEYFDSEAETCVKIEVKGGGSFLSYSNASPKKGFLNGAEAAFEWLDNGKLALNLPWTETAGGVSNVAFLF
jgi:stachyose synthetase